MDPLSSAAADPTMTWALSDESGELRTIAPPRAEPATPPPSSPLPDRYEDLGFLDRGGMSELRRVRDRVLGAELAMKLLAWKYLGDDKTKALFLAEARATAQLQHPGIVAVQDYGELEDGRLWFTMAIVRGQTLEALARSRASQRRKLGVLKQVADIVAYAHELGAVHRDLKPDNVMIGPFGEVMVMDWGLATVPGISHPLESNVIVGTPMFMAPEQARGERATAASDVYALGGMLYRLLADDFPQRGTAMGILQTVRRGTTPSLPEVLDTPDALRTLCDACLARDPDERPAAVAISEGLETWLDGVQRRQEALATVAEARDALPDLQRLEVRARGLQEDAQARLDALSPDAPVSAKEPAWALEDEAATLLDELELRRVHWHQQLRAALTRSPDLPEAHDLLADHYRHELELAERARDRSAITRNEALLEEHDRGRHAAYLRGNGAVSLITDVPCHARLSRFVLRKRRLVPEPVRDLGTTPIREVDLERGSYLITLTRPGHREVRYPVLIERASHWDGVPPGGDEPRVIPIPREADLHPEDVYVPAGWCIVGGDPDAADSLPWQKVWIEGFAMRRFAVTFGEYVAWLRELIASDDERALEEAWPWRHDRDRYVVRTGDDIRLAQTISARHPVVGVTHAGATAFARAQGCRLPNELWVEKAGRGADGRFTPWGDQVEPQWSRIRGSPPSRAGTTPVDAFEQDESLYGVRGLSGNTFTWCSNLWTRGGPIAGSRLLEAPQDGATHFSLRGGSYMSTTVFQRLASRLGEPPHTRATVGGLRLAQDAW